MGEVAWVRKYRPSSFDDYMGEDVKRMVMTRFSNRDAIPNTIMLYGTRGTGKTSMARLLSKEIHCLSPVDGHSCGECDMCQAIDEYITSTEAGVECPGITEVDAATTTGKSDINDIIEDAIIPPLYPMNYKVVIMDECHQLSVSAQNSLLKVIEEPPSHLIFILCTTDPEKVIGTIHSRMQLKLEVRKKSVDEMVNKLLQIAQNEKLEISREALQVIAKKGDRIPRECINLLESIAKTFGNQVTLDSVRKALGDTSAEIYMEYFKAANTSLESILKFNKRLQEKDISPKDFIKGLTRFNLDALYIKHGISLDDFPIEFVKQIKDLFKIYKSADMDTILQVIESAYRQIDSDDTKGELIITTTALRIGKVQLLAQGLAGQLEQARKENEDSIKKYKEYRDSEREESLNKYDDFEVNKESMASRMGNLVSVSGDASQIFEGEIEEDSEKFIKTEKDIAREKLFAELGFDDN